MTVPRPLVPFVLFLAMAVSAWVPAAGEEVTDCLPETVCVAAAIPTRAEILIRIVGPKPNGRLWPQIVRFNTTKTEVWIQQITTGRTKYYVLPAVAQSSETLPGLIDRTGFLP